MENKNLFSQGAISSETTNEAQTQTYGQQSTNFETQEEDKIARYEFHIVPKKKLTERPAININQQFL